jgi:hypothetical protein
MRRTEIDDLEYKYKIERQFAGAKKEVERRLKAKGRKTKKNKIK